MTQKHTPGPWTYEGGVNADIISHITAHGEFQHCDIAYLTLSNHKANAHLIAAAPDLLEALLEARAYVPEHHGPAVHKIRAAIAKATGEPHNDHR